MADIEYGDTVDGEIPRLGVDMAGLVNGLGAAVSVALVAGLGFWGYQLMVRDVTGVPVVRALEGPMRIAPDEPGGRDAEYQGLAVNNIAAQGETEAPANRLVLAPKPTAMTAEDQPAGIMQEQAAAAAPVIVNETSVIEPITTDIAASVAVPTPDVGAAEIEPVVTDAPAVLDQAALIEATILLLDDEPAADAIAPLANPDAIPASVSGVARSMRPFLRPATLLTTIPVASVASDPSEPGVRSIDPSAIPIGTRLAQLGAFDSVDVAKSEWTKFAAQFEDVMAGKARVIEQAQSGGKTFYRLRAHGFVDLSDARRFCSTLLAEQANCIPVVTR